MVKVLVVRFVCWGFETAALATMPAAGVAPPPISPTLDGMSLPPDQPPPTPPPKPKLTTEERRARQADQLMRIRFRMMIGSELEERGITTPAGIGKALGMPPAEATKLLTRHQWREGDLLLLQAVADRMELQVPGLGPWWP